MSTNRVRQNVHELGGDWADPILWYARGVKAMQARALNDRTSWRFYGAIHGIWRALWDFYGITTPADPGPLQADIDAYWFQCQHGSYYFLPWHRGYLLALENIIRHEIELLGGPHETWALPYWNYFKPGQNALPNAFATPIWPDGGTNPLFVPQRWGVSGNHTIPVGQIYLTAMTDQDFTGVATGGSPGFGGIDTGFSLGGQTHGGIETQPHDWVHGLVGGSNPDLSVLDPNGNPLPGLMSHPRSAALDPIFWLHHANLDRLWESWNFFPPGKPAPTPTSWKNPTDSKWLNGPVSIGEREFALPNPDGSKWTYVPGGMQNIAALGYSYDDLTPGRTPPTLALRMGRLGIQPTGRGVPSIAGGAMASSSTVEAVGENQGQLTVAGSERLRVGVRTQLAARQRVMTSLSGLGPTGLPDRIFLNLESVRSLIDSAAFSVYVGLPEGADPNEHPELLAGGIALFGASEASNTESVHGGNGLNYVLEITDLVDRLQLDKKFDLDELPVDIFPVGSIPQTAKLTIDRIKIYRQEQ